MGAQSTPTKGKSRNLSRSDYMADDKKVQTVGRRKAAVVRVLLRPGSGDLSVNGRTLAEYFPRPSLRIRIEEPLKLVEAEGNFDIKVRAMGGGLTGQADALRMGIARALVAVDEEHRQPLREGGMLTRDARKVERKKPGRPKARKRFQFSKR